MKDEPVMLLGHEIRSIDMTGIYVMLGVLFVGYLLVVKFEAWAKKDKSKNRKP
ncbi:hypothetical protein JMG10_07770 [Nostoc ellipsosporum NOK]|nr:hypothetical protein [Nostoc ellipsosporum NOK]